jgi:hypothetical protein
MYESNCVLLVIPDDDMKCFNKNKVLFINNNKYEFNILKVDDLGMERNGDKYNNVFIEVSFFNMFEIGEVVNITIMDNRDFLFKIFNAIWDGE